MYAEIIIDITHEKLDRTFEYKVPEELEGTLAVGSSVLVPFGNGDKVRTGFIIGFSEKSSFDPAKIKEIRGKAPKSVRIEENLVALAAWMKEHYGGLLCSKGRIRRQGQGFWRRFWKMRSWITAGF